MNALSPASEIERQTDHIRNAESAENKFRKLRNGCVAGSILPIVATALSVAANAGVSALDVLSGNMFPFSLCCGIVSLLFVGLAIKSHCNVLKARKDKADAFDALGNLPPTSIRVTDRTTRKIEWENYGTTQEKMLCSLSDQPIHVNIAQCPSYLSEENFEEIVGLINSCTLNQRPLPNHNGGHAARKTRTLEILFDLIQKRGSSNARETFNCFSPEEKIALKLAAYLSRSGRVDESQIKVFEFAKFEIDDTRQELPDSFDKRSAEIYGAYATQLGVSDEVSKWAQNLIMASANDYIEIPGKYNPKFRLANTLLQVAHNLDLGRCVAEQEMVKILGRLKDKLFIYFSRKESESIVANLHKHAQVMQKITGLHDSLDPKVGVDIHKFRYFTEHGKECLSTLRKLKFNV